MEVMFGENVSYNDPEFLSIVKTYRSWFDAAEADNPADFFTFLRKFPNKRLSIIQNCGKVFEEFSMKYLQRLRENVNNNNNNNNGDAASKSNNLMQTLFNEYRIDTDDDAKEVAKVISDLVGGGFDTSVATLSWGLLYLVRKPEVLK